MWGAQKKEGPRRRLLYLCCARRWLRDSEQRAKSGGGGVLDMYRSMEGEKLIFRILVVDERTGIGF